jgi:predicted small lipoprotein YifL
MKKNLLIVSVLFINLSSCGIKGPPLPPLDIAPPVLIKTEPILPLENSNFVKKPTKKLKKNK